MLLEQGLLDSNRCIGKAWVLKNEEEFSVWVRAIRGRGSSLGKEGQSLENRALGGLSIRRRGVLEGWVVRLRSWGAASVGGPWGEQSSEAGAEEVKLGHRRSLTWPGWRYRICGIVGSEGGELAWGWTVEGLEGPVGWVQS